MKDHVPAPTYTRARARANLLILKWYSIPINAMKSVSVKVKNLRNIKQQMKKKKKME